MLDHISLMSTDPLDIVPKQSYPSGAKDEHNPVYRWGYDATENPIVRIPYTIRDNAGFIAPSGIYEVILSDDKKFFLLVQSKKLIFKVPVVSYEEKELPVINTNENSKKKKRVIEAAKVQARRKAYIKDTRKDYYVLIYKTEKVEAYGVIPY